MSPSVAVWHCPQPPDRVHGHRDDCPAPFMCPLPSVVVWHCPQPPDRIHGHRDDCPAPFMCPLPSVVVWRCPQPPDRVHGHRDDCPAPFMCPLPSVAVWRCPQPPDRVHGHRDDCPSPFMYGTRCHYECDAGYEPVEPVAAGIALLHCIAKMDISRNEYYMDWDHAPTPCTGNSAVVTYLIQR